MALPSNVSYTKVTGRFIRAVGDTLADGDDLPDEVAIPGLTITFTPQLSPPRVKNVSSTPPTTITLSPIIGTTNSTGNLTAPDGSVGIYLVSSNDPDLSPSGWTYLVSITGPNFTTITFSFIAQADSEMDLTSMVPVPPNPGTELLLWQQAVADAEAAADAAAASAAAAQAAADSVGDVSGLVAQAEAAAADADADADAAADSAVEANAASATANAHQLSASASASTASTAASTASTAATNAGTSETNAAASASAAAASAATIKTYRSESFTQLGTVPVGVGTTKVYNDSGKTLTIKFVRASVGTAPTGASLIVDVNKNGTTLFTTQSTRPTIAASGTTNKTTPQVTTWADGDYLTVDIDQVGSTIPGSDLTVTISLEASN